MANGDLIAKLRLDSKEFDTNINRSRRQVNDFQKNTDSFAGAGIKAFAGFAGGVLAGAATLETFNKFMNSTQTTGDLLGNNLVALQGTVDAFFVSLNSGDWNAFSNGVINAYRNMKAFADLMDELEDKRLALTFVSADNMKDLARFEEIIKDPNSTQQEKIDAAQNYKGIVNFQAKRTKETNDLEIEALKKNYSARSGMNIDLGDMRYFAANTNADANLTNESIETYKEHLRLQKEFEKLRKAAEYDAINNGYDPTKGVQKEYADLKKVSGEFFKQNEFMIKQGFIANESDENRKNLYKTLSLISKQEEDIYLLQVKGNKLEKQAHKGKESTNSPTKKPDEPAKEGSIEELENKLTKLKKDLKTATTDEARRMIQVKINELEKTIKELDDKLKKSTTTPDLLKSSSKITGEKPLYKSIKNDLNSGNIKVQGVEPTKLLDTNKEDLDYLNTMSNLMNSIANTTGMASDNFLGYTANVLSGIGQLLPQLFQVFAIKSKIAIADSAALPPPLNIIAMGATAAALASTIAGLPKFENGGIVPGTSFSGDKVLASVNSGEMILNKSQQSNLFGLLNSSRGVSSTVGGAGEVQFKVQGKDLIGVLNNYNNKFSRI